MASMNFPPTPTVGEEYVWEDFIYEWDGEKWTTQVTVVADNHVLKSGDTMAGDLEVPMVYLQSGQVDAPNATTRKDYVDGNFIKNTGGYITGPLTVDMPNNGIPLVLGVPNPTDKQEIQGWSGNTLKWAVGVPNDNNTSTYLTNHVDGVSIALASYGAISSHPVLTNAAQPIDANSLTRKDYVDNGFVQRNEVYDGDLNHLALRTGMYALGANITNAPSNTNKIGDYLIQQFWNNEAICQIYSDFVNSLLLFRTYDGGGWSGWTPMIMRDAVSSSRVDTLEDRIITLESQNASLIARIEALEARLVM